MNDKKDFQTVPAHSGLPTKTVVHKFGEYEITVSLTANNEFIGVKEIGIEKSFYTYNSTGIELDEFYKE